MDKRFKKKLFQNLGLIFLAILAPIIVAGEWYRGVISLQEPPMRPDLAVSTDSLKTLIWTDKGGAASAELVRLWVLVENQTKEAIPDLHFLTFQTPGFDQVGPCWKAHTPACALESQQTNPPKQSGLPKPLGQGLTAVVYADLSPRHSFGRHGVSGILAWTNPDKKQLQRAVILPGIEVHSKLWDVVSGIVKAIELCALPVALAFFAWWLKQQQDQREATAKLDREWQARLQETWLPRALEHINAYYMPVASAIQELLQQSNKVSKSIKNSEALTEEELNRLLFRFLRLIRRMTDLAEKIGGFHFQNYQGEHLAAQCWAEFEKIFRTKVATAKEDGARVSDAISPAISLAQFMDLVNGSRATGLSDLQRRRIARGLSNLKLCIEKWASEESFRTDLTPLAVLFQILLFEMDRPFEPWYGHLDKFPSKSFREAMEELPHTSSYYSLRKKLDLYKKICEVSVRRSLTRYRKSQRASDL